MIKVNNLKQLNYLFYHFHLVILRLRNAMIVDPVIFHYYYINSKIIIYYLVFNHVVNIVDFTAFFLRYTLVNLNIHLVELLKLY